MTKEYILQKLKEIKPQYQKDGVDILGIFGSYSKDTFKNSSDIDIAYILDEAIFFKKHRGFKSVCKISDIKEQLSILFKKKIDFISLKNSNESLVTQIKKDMIYV